MLSDGVDRRSFLKSVGSAGLSTAFPVAAFGASSFAGPIVEEKAEPAQSCGGEAGALGADFSVAGMSHDHIYGNRMDAMIRGGGVLVSVYAAEPERGAAFLKRYPQAKAAQSEDEILNDASIQLALSSAVPNTRAPLGVRVMRHGKDYLSDKPAVTTLEQLAEVRKAIEETKRIYAIMYSERLEVKAAGKAGELVQAGAIGRVIQTINIAPHQIVQKGGDAGGGTGRPEWFWDPEKYGGILCDIGSHQVDQFLFYTGSTKAEVVASQVANVRHKDRPKFQDFGDMMLRGNSGFGYVRLDWFTPDGLGTWGDGRLFILGSNGYMEIRKYADVTRSKTGNHLFIVDAKEARYIDCNNLTLPFGPQFIADVVNRTHVAQDQTQCLLAAELVIRAQQGATHAAIEG